MLPPTSIRSRPGSHFTAAPPAGRPKGLPAPIGASAPGLPAVSVGRRACTWS